MQNLTIFLNERKSRYQKKICRAEKQEKQAREVLKDEPDRQDVREDLHKVINIQCKYKALIKLIDEIQETLKEYENLEKQNKLLKLPCAVGDTVYTNISMPGWYFRKENRPYEAKVVFIGVNGADNYMNIDYGNGHMFQFNFSDIGKTVFLTKKEALQEINKRDTKNGGNKN